MKKIAVLTSGGDAPGMNAAVRAVVRSALHHSLEVYGVYHGYQGLLQNDLQKLNRRDVSNLLSRGGTFLKTSRCEEFRTPEGRKKAADCLREEGIEGLVVIGGDGSFTGAKLLEEEQDIAIVGIPGTIDNDIYGTDNTIGYDTAVNTAVSAVDKIRDTATSHERIFFVEVMGRDSGYIAISTAIACGAEAVAIPEDKSSVERIIDSLDTSKALNKTSSIIITAEGKTATMVSHIVERLNERIGDPDVIRYVPLGHIQRGGSPSVMDRILASRLGASAVDSLMSGKRGVMVGIMNGNLVHTPIHDAISKTKRISDELISLTNVLI